MENEDKYRPAERDIDDLPNLAVRGATRLIPAIGPPLSSLLTLVWGDPLTRRSQAWMESIGRGLLELEVDHGVLKRKVGLLGDEVSISKRELEVVIEHLSSNDAFIDIALEASRQALRTSQQEKLEGLRNAVLNSALPHAPEVSMQHLFLDLVGQFTPIHIGALHFFDDPVGWLQKQGRPFPGDWVGKRFPLDKALHLAYPELTIQQNFGGLVLAEIISKKLILSDTRMFVMKIDPKLGGSAEESRRTSDMGKQFVKFISAPSG